MVKKFCARYEIIFASNFVINNLIDYKNLINNAWLMTKNIAIETMIGQDAGVFEVKIMNLNAKVFVKKTMIVFVFEIDDGNIHMALIFIN